MKVTMSNDEFIQLVTKVLANEATEPERIQFTTLLERKEFSQLFTQLRLQWENAQDSPDRAQFDSANGLHLLAKKIQKHEPTFVLPETDRNDSLFRSRLWLAVAFVLLILLPTGIFYFIQTTRNPSSEVVWDSQSTLMGEKSILTLLDGTRITLNAGSTIRFRKATDMHVREVYLEGEAYFDVSHDDTKPFVVHAQHVSTEVLGTKFNISAYADDKEIVVSLVEGKIKVSEGRTATSNGGVILQPMQQLAYHKSDGFVTIEEFGLLETIGWKDDKLVFKNVPLENILVKLERRFGVTFELTDKQHGKRKITADFETESIQTVAEVLKKLTGLNYRMVKEQNELKRVVFEPRK
jgi:ferric-dicitrate binding protein FerR (iron transport regulator)